MSKTQRQTPGLQAVILLKIAMGLVYLFLGLYISFNQALFSGLGQAAGVLGIACILYGVFRLYRAYLDFKGQQRAKEQAQRGIPPADDTPADS